MNNLKNKLEYKQKSTAKGQNLEEVLFPVYSSIIVAYNKILCQYLRCE